MSVFLTYFLNGNPTLVYGQFSILISLLVFSVFYASFTSGSFSVFYACFNSGSYQFSMFVSLPVPFPFVVLSLTLNRKFVKQSTTTRIMFKPSSYFSLFFSYSMLCIN